MRLIGIRRPIWAASSCSVRTIAPVSWTVRPELALPQRDAANAAAEGRRHASVKSQGAYKIVTKSTIPKKMGAKRMGDTYVIPGNIIYKQRGTIWHPGENTIMGRDFTIHAAVAGYVKYYRDPFKHPDRQYIGVVFNKDDKLPYHPTWVRRRKLNMVAVERKAPTPYNPISPSGLPRSVTREKNWKVVASAALPSPTGEVDPNASQPEAVAAAEAAEEASPWDKRKKGQSRASFGRRLYQWNLHDKRAVRVLRLHKNYAYYETNADIGKLMGTHQGKTPGTVRLASRHGVMRAKARRQAQAAQKQLQFFREAVQSKRETAEKEAKAKEAKEKKDMEKKAKEAAKKAKAAAAEGGAVAEKTKEKASEAPKAAQAPKGAAKVEGSEKSAA